MVKVLVAEDEKNVRELFSRTIESMGYAAISSPDGRLAWEILQANPDIKMLVSDIAMPGMDGRELIKLIRQHQEYSSLPIVVVSGVIRAREISQLLSEGATCFLAKPVDLKELREVITTHVPQQA